MTVESFLGPIGTVLLFLIAGAGAWAGSYLREKGKHYATREDFQKVLEQVSPRPLGRPRNQGRNLARVRPDVEAPRRDSVMLDPKRRP